METVVNKQISIDGLAKLAKIVLKNNIFECDEKTFTLKREIVIGTKFSHPYFFYCWSWGKNVANFWKKKNDLIYIWHKNGDIFLIWEHDEEWLKVFIGRVNMLHPTVNSIAEYSKEEFNLLYLNIKLVDGDIKILLQLLHNLITAKKEHLRVQYQGLIGFV